MKNTILLALAFTVSMLLFSCDQKKELIFTESDINIIPKPVELVLNKGSFHIDDNTTIVAHDSLKNVANIFVDKLKSSGVEVVFSENSAKNSIAFVVNQELENGLKTPDRIQEQGAA